MTNLEKLESSIRSAIPELMELTEGCVIEYDDQFFQINETNTIDKSSQIYIKDMDSWVFSDEYEIIGHPVTILHLLRWLDMTGWAKLYSSGVIYMRKIPSVQLDLSKPNLRDQSEEVIDELVKLVEG